MKREKEPLYRKVNTKARGVHHNVGSEARYDRNTKQGISSKMKKNDRRGLDYTPLYKFLLSKVGKNFDEVFSEAVNRLDKEDAIWHIVIDPNDAEQMRYRTQHDHVRCGGHSIYSALYVDDNGILQIVNPNLRNEDFVPGCPCCTHTFNGKPLSRKYLNKEGTRNVPENVNLA